MSDTTPTAQEAAIAMAAAKADPFFTAAYEALFERRRKLEAEQTLIDMNNAIDEMDVAGKAHGRARDLERSAYAHLIEAKKVWRIAMQLAEAETTNLQAACAKAQALIDARKAARQSLDRMVEIAHESGMYHVVDGVLKAGRA